MGNIPIKDSPEVATRPASPAYFDAHATPDDFGAQVGRAISQTGDVISQPQIRKRQTDATFAAADAELRFGKDMDQQVEGFKNDAKALQAENVGDYQQAMADLRVKYDQGIEKTRNDYEGALADPLARKNFAVRTRLQTQAASRHMLVNGDQAVSSWRQQTVESGAALSVKRAGNVSGDINTDLLNLQVQISTGLKPIQDYWETNQVPDETKKQATFKLEHDAVNSALAGYGDNYQAGMAFLNAKLIGTGVRIGFSPSEGDKVPFAPGEGSILNGAETQKWVDHFTKISHEKIGAGLGLEWKLGGVTNPVEAARKYVEGGGKSEVAYKAIMEYDSLQSRQHTQEQYAEAKRFKNSYEIVASQFGRDVDAADRAGALNGVPIMQRDQLRELFKKRDDDPSYTVGRSQFSGVIAAGPGWSDNWTADTFMSTWLPRVGPRRFEELRHDWEQDQRRPKAMDGSVGREFALLDNRLRMALDWQENGDPARRSWAGAGIQTWQMDLHEYAVTEFNKAVEQYHEQVKAGKRPEGNYFDKVRNQIFQKMLNGAKEMGPKTPMPAPIFTQQDHPGVPPSVQGYLAAPAGSTKITDGKSVGWLPPGTALPAGWQEAP